MTFDDPEFTSDENGGIRSAQGFSVYLGRTVTYVEGEKKVVIDFERLTGGVLLYLESATGFEQFDRPGAYRVLTDISRALRTRSFSVTTDGELPQDKQANQEPNQSPEPMPLKRHGSS